MIMKKNTYKIFLLLIFVCLLPSCIYAKSGQIIEEFKIEPAFNAISVCCGIQLFLTQSNEQNIVVVADEKDIDRLIIENRQGTLSISLKSNNFIFRRNKLRGLVKVFVSFTNLDELKISSAASASSENFLKLEDFDLKASSGAHCNLNLRCLNMMLNASSGAAVKLIGNGNNVLINVSSGASAMCGDFKVNNAQLKASSGANINIEANGVIDASSSSGANIAVSGSGRFETINQSSGGLVVKH